jgi:hypothetical protein
MTSKIGIMMLAVAMIAVAAHGQAFTIIAIPDTQNYSQSNSATFNSQTQWIVDNKASQNIAFVTHLGDITNVGTDTAQWGVANTAMSKLDGVVPYSACFGNHDVYWDSTGGTGIANCKAYFGDSRYAGKSWYLGASTDGLSFAQKFTASGYTIMNINLPFTPSSADLAWAQGIINANLNVPTMISTHDYLNVGGRDSVGDNIYNTLVKSNTQIFMTLNGHYHGENRQLSTNAGGNVLEMLSDYQDYPNGGNGYLRQIQFDPTAGKINVKTYSTTLQAFETDANSQFSYNATFSVNSIKVTGEYVAPPPVTATLLSRGTTWKYLNPLTGTDPGVGATFMNKEFSDAAWASGQAVLGYGQSDQPGFVKTDVGTPASGLRNTAYFRTTFQVDNPTYYTDLLAEITRDDGAVVYLNGHEVFRTNMPTGPVNYFTSASSSIGGTDETTWYTITGLTNYLVAGTNVLAVEVHQGANTSSDLSFDMDLKATVVPEPATMALLAMGGLALIRRRK